MILEAVVLNVRSGEEAAFKDAFRVARPLIASTPGFGSIEIRQCVETPNRYLLLVTWRTVEDHIIGFRRSSRYQEWRNLLHHFYDPFPAVEHYKEPIELD